MVEVKVRKLPNFTELWVNGQYILKGDRFEVEAYAEKLRAALEDTENKPLEAQSERFEQGELS